MLLNHLTRCGGTCDKARPDHRVQWHHELGLNQHPPERAPPYAPALLTSSRDPTQLHARKHPPRLAQHATTVVGLLLNRLS
jgi:hypothetical protein